MRSSRRFFREERKEKFSIKLCALFETFALLRFINQPKNPIIKYKTVVIIPPIIA
jgi:hypothetical protein